MSRQGPTLTIVATCRGCDLARTETYSYQGSRGFDVYCSHEDARTETYFDKPTKGFVADSAWTTPDWCPLLKAAKEAFVEALQEPT